MSKALSGAGGSKFCALDVEDGKWTAGCDGGWFWGPCHPVGWRRKRVNEAVQNAAALRNAGHGMLGAVEAQNMSLCTICDVQSDEMPSGDTAFPGIYRRMPKHGDLHILPKPEPQNPSQQRQPIAALHLTRVLHTKASWTLSQPEIITQFQHFEPLITVLYSAQLPNRHSLFLLEHSLFEKLFLPQHSHSSTRLSTMNMTSRASPSCFDICSGIIKPVLWRVALHIPSTSDILSHFDNR
ncbi:hypothetical protein BDZ45DRAFT_807468 [Acephala macrosclerotiorum]|nr:hypothetical protein BDZ45DRAFT_807468 [Acephala macrosclerotiorum]